jgi:hypothetical protein
MAVLSISTEIFPIVNIKENLCEVHFFCPQNIISSIAHNPSSSVDINIILYNEEEGSLDSD